MIGLHGIISSLITIWMFCQQTQAESCEDPGWCAGLGDAFCKTHDFIKKSCKTMCGECKGSDQATYCPDVASIAFGDTITSSTPPYMVGTTVNFTCDPGFRGSGQTTIICLSSGEWSDDTPYCTLELCKRDKSKREKGRTCQPRCVKGSCKNRFHTCRCDDWCGRTCFNPQDKCEKLSAPKNGEIIDRGRRYGQRVTYKCKPGHTLVGPSSRSCRSDKKWSGYDPYCVPFSACGFTEKNTEDTVRVVNGKDAKKGAWPWQVAVIKSEGYSIKQMYKNTVVGGGSVITDEWVLSASHVFTDLFDKNTKSNNWSNTFLLVFGMESFATPSHAIPEHIQIFEPETVILHPKFSRRTLDFDVAMVRIGKRLKRGPDGKFIPDESVPGGKVTFTRFVRPVCLPCMKGGVLGPADAWKNFAEDRCDQKDESIFPSFAPTGSEVTVTGFGVINPLRPGAQPDERVDLPLNLQEGRINITDPDTCARDMVSIRSKVEHARYTERMFCASGGTEQKKVDACQGDSGGPVVKKMKLRKNSQVIYWMQLGIVSWGLGCASKYHGYYVSVPSIMKWVWKTLDDGKKGVWGDWSQWGTCDVSCGVGEMSRTRTCQGSKNCDGKSLDTQKCEEKPCQGDWGEWLPWTECSDVCGGGEKTRRRSCIGPESCIGEDEEEADCYTQNCEWSDWSQWSECSASCDSGKTKRSRTCQRPGKCPGPAEEMITCVIKRCQGVWTQWDNWSKCSRTCGGGDRKRTRKCEGPGICDGESSKTEKCNMKLCPGFWTQWSAWSKCSRTCGSGNMKRSRSCFGPGLCVGKSIEEEPCNTKICPGIWAQWGNWNICSRTCGRGVKTRTRTCKGPGSCVGSSRRKVECNTKPCPGNWGLWTAWKQCDVTCGGGHRERTRTCLGPADCVGHKVETRGCNSQDCEDGVWSSWGLWGACSATCGGGKMGRERWCQGPGRCRGDDFDDKDCETQLCPGVWREWATWSRCTRTCGGGKSRRRRTCAGPGQCQGSTLQDRDCNQQSCLGTWGLWTQWSSCSTIGCEGGTRVRFRRCTSGRCVGDSQEMQACTFQCQDTWSRWTQWSACSTTCGEGERLRTRVCRGSKCPGDDFETGRCNVGAKPCPTLAAVPWGPCSVSCGGGVKTRRNGGQRETESCNTIACVWSECTKPCGGGKKERKNCVWANFCSTVTIDCNTQPC